MRQRFNAQEYSKIRDEAKKYFLAKKTGEPNLFTEESKLYMPIIQSTKNLEKNLISTLSTPEHALPQLEFGHSSPVASSVVRVNLDGELLNETHSENLQDMSFKLPSKVYERNSIEKTLKKITKMNRSLRQCLGTSSKRTEKEKEMYQSQKQTLQINI